MLDSMHGAVQRQGMQKRALGTHDVEAPSGPVLDVLSDLAAQFGDGKERLILGALQVMNFDPCIVDDLFVIVHKVKEAAHFGTVTPLNRMESASGFCHRSEDSIPDQLSFVFGRSLAHRVETVQLDPADIGPRSRYEVGPPIFEALDFASNRPLVSGRTIHDDRSDLDMV
ncbi:hypothetical protein KBI52_23420 [Microvirga sp. HBU67558]|uniref:hypothetical protein n=1 Tax=Microvirga yunnanensis TaxID=2953740 RepID=UPI001AEF1AC1|nr:MULTISPECIES: hypothetical protein [unclassified Microvirga]MBQ0823144.1 hypothetical protein [Microvirga sp. HBU67558]